MKLENLDYNLLKSEELLYHQIFYLNTQYLKILFDKNIYIRNIILLRRSENAIFKKNFCN
jgi:hypothetical protein